MWKREGSGTLVIGKTFLVIKHLRWKSASFKQKNNYSLKFADSHLKCLITKKVFTITPPEKWKSEKGYIGL